MYFRLQFPHVRSHPSWVCGLKLTGSYGTFHCLVSHPSWVCGLKHKNLVSYFIRFSSHPSWVCGLKLKIVQLIERLTKVTPFVGVWIETSLCELNQSTTGSHPSWVCGLKPRWWHRLRSHAYVTPFVGVWIETCRYRQDSRTW